MNKLLLALPIIACLGCSGPSMKDCGLNRISNMSLDDYDVKVNTKTPAGIPVDTGGINYDLAYIDDMTYEVKDCLAKNFPDFTISDEVFKASYCRSKDFSSSYHAAWNFGCWQVKIDNNWVKSCDGKQQLLSEISPTMPGQSCGGKPNVIPTKECPCRFRVGIIGKTIVVPPDARLFKDGLVRAITGCENPWGHSLLAECAKPSF